MDRQTIREKIQYYSSNPILLIGIATGLIGIILIIAMIINANSSFKFEGQTKIDNLASLIPDLPSNSREHMYHTLYTRLKADEVSPVPTSGALIRENTLNNTYDEDENYHYANFVVDIESVRHSYWIQIEWSDDENNPYITSQGPVVSCPMKNHIIYPEQNCSDHAANIESETGNDPYLILLANTPYTGATKKGLVFGIDMAHYTSGDPYISVSANTCAEESLRNDVKTAAEEWLASLDLVENDIPVYYRDLCDGGY